MKTRGGLICPPPLFEGGGGGVHKVVRMNVKIAKADHDGGKFCVEGAGVKPSVSPWDSGEDC